MLEMFVRRVDDGVHLFGRDVALNKLEGLPRGEDGFS
jgi:hypothetical protein